MPNFGSNLNIICLEEEAFFALLEQSVERLQAKQGREPDVWISDQEAMQLLRIKSKTTLQKLRDEGAIRFSQPMKKHIVYDRSSILNYLEKHAKDTF
ncbi:MAG: helix-turn-helix domain-containing protein [Bacteroidota bacterium]